MSVVYIEHAPDEHAVEALTTSLMSKLGASNEITRAKYIIVKPNYVVADHWTTGNTTCPAVLDAIVCFIKSANPDARVAIGEGGFTHLTQEAFRVNGLPDICKRHDIDLIDFNADEHELVTIEGARSLKSVEIAREALRCDLVISVPSLKTHSMATTTLSMKNFMGTLGHKSIMHSRLHDKIVDLFSFFKPKAPFALVDGFIGSDGYECGGSPVRHEVLLASRDFVALDTIGSYLMGQDLTKCAYLRKASGRGLGTDEMGKIKVDGIELDKHVKKYKEG